MFTSVDGASPGYTALAPHILAPRHVSPPPILGNSRVTYSTSCFGWPSSAEALDRMGGGYPECMANSKSTLRWAMELGLSQIFVLAALAMPLVAVANSPEIHSISKNGTKFRHFELMLSSTNTLLPSDPRIRRERLDESSKNFEYGQFEVFIPANELNIGLGCKTNYIVRMPMTLASEKTTEIMEKQALFFAIKKVVEAKAGAVRVVIEISYDKGCNLFFRSGPGGRYIDYVGPSKR